MVQAARGKACLAYHFRRDRRSARRDRLGPDGRRPLDGRRRLVVLNRFAPPTSSPESVWTVLTEKARHRPKCRPRRFENGHEQGDRQQRDRPQGRASKSVDLGYDSGRSEAPIKVWPATSGMALSPSSADRSAIEFTVPFRLHSERWRDGRPPCPDRRAAKRRTQSRACSGSGRRAVGRRHGANGPSFRRNRRRGWPDRRRRRRRRRGTLASSATLGLTPESFLAINDSYQLLRRDRWSARNGARRIRT